MCPLPDHTFKHLVMTAGVLFVSDDLFSVIIPSRDVQRHILLKVDISVPCPDNNSTCWFGDGFLFKLGFTINRLVNNKLKSCVCVNSMTCAFFEAEQ